VAAWDAGATCEAVSVSFDAGIVQVDVAMLDSVPGTDELVGDLDNPFTESGSKDLRVGTPTTFRLTPVPADGFSVVPEFIDVTVPVCDDPTSSTAPAAASVPELPLTGMSNTLWATLVFVGASSAVLGWVFVMSGREDE
jgi:LPXTG-motif cell wall-anchored protein